MQYNASLLDKWNAAWDDSVIKLVYINGAWSGESETDKLRPEKLSTGANGV